MSDRVEPKPFPMTTADRYASDKLWWRPNFLSEQNKVPIPKRHPSSQVFHDLCDEMKAMHDKKQSDYGRANDPFANVRASEDFGMQGWVGAMVRANDKMRRIQKAAQGGTLSNEGVEDSLMDLAVYSIIALVLYREQPKPPEKGRAADNPYPEPVGPKDIWRGAQFEPLIRWDRPADGPSPLDLAKERLEDAKVEAALNTARMPRGRFVQQENGEVWYVTDPEVGQ